MKKALLFFCVYLVTNNLLGQETTIGLSNTEQGDHTAIDGLIYYDRNFSFNYPEFTGGEGGGLSVFNYEDGWGALISTNNMQWLTPTFDGGIFNGNVGIGNDSPDEKLHVTGSGHFHYSVGGIKIDNVYNEQANDYVRSSIISSRDGDLEWDQTNDVWTLGSGNSNDFACMLHTHNGELGFFTGTSNAFTELSNTDFRNQFQRLTITGNGNVGIGTNNPDNKLEVNGSVKINEKVIGKTLTIDLDAGSSSYPKRITSNAIGGAATMEFQTYSGVNQKTQTRLLIRGSGASDIEFYDNTETEYVHFDGDTKKVGIGTSNPTDMLTVAGNIHGREVKVTVNAGADFVFNENYPIPSLEEVETFVKQNKHLPEIAPAVEMEANGIKLGEMNIKLLQKIEELTLYLIEQNKKNIEQSEKIEDLKTEAGSWEKEVKELKEQNKAQKGIINELIKRIEKLESNN